MKPEELVSVWMVSADKLEQIAAVCEDGAKALWMKASAESLRSAARMLSAVLDGSSGTEVALAAYRPELVKAASDLVKESLS